MRICIYTQDISTYLGGVQSVVALVAGRLVNLGHSVTILCPETKLPPDLRRPLHADIEVERIRTHPECRQNKPVQLLSRALLALVKRGLTPKLPRWLNGILRGAFLRRPESNGVLPFLNDNEFDVVIGAGASQSLFLSVIRDQIGSRVVGWEHSTFGSYFETRGVALYGLENLAKESFPLLDEVIVLNSADQNEFYERLGVQPQVFANPVARPAVRRSSSPGANRVVFVGRISVPIKGVDLLVEAFSEVNKRHSDWVLRIYGAGPDMDSLEQYVTDYGLNDNVELMGATRDAYSALASGSISAFSSRYEGFGISLVEAMRVGLPCVAFAADGPRDIITDGVDGFLVDLGDVKLFAERLVTLIENPELRKTMGKRAMESAEAYDPDVLIPEFLRIIGGTN